MAGKRGSSIPAEVYAEAVRLMNEESLGVTETAKRLGISYNTLYSAIKRDYGRIARNTDMIMKGGRPGAKSMRYDPFDEKVYVVQGVTNIVFNREEFIDMTMAVLDMLEKLDRLGDQRNNDKEGYHANVGAEL